MAYIEKFGRYWHWSIGTERGDTRTLWGGMSSVLRALGER